MFHVNLDRWQGVHACPCAAVFLNCRPHKPLGHQLDGGVGTGVTGRVGCQYLALKGVVMNGRGFVVDVSQ